MGPDDYEKLCKDYPTREDRKKLAAACPRCGGWTGYGGMSQYAKGEDGCTCTRLPREK
jgi:hypothetical protein